MSRATGTIGIVALVFEAYWPARLSLAISFFGIVIFL
jgi:hypothetical protein